jgi:hypothetical protein
MGIRLAGRGRGSKPERRKRRELFDGSSLRRDSDHKGNHRAVQFRHRLETS